MAEFIEFQVKGLQEALANLKAIGVDMEKKGGRFALRKAAQVIRDKARANALGIDDPESAEKISKNITERWSSKLNKRSGGKDMGFRVGVLGGAADNSSFGELQTGKNASQNPGGDTFHWRYVEFGTAKMAAHPFMRPALEQSQQEVISTFLREYDKALDRALKKAGVK